DAGRRVVRVTREQGEIDEADVGPSEDACRHAVAGHVDHLESRFFHHARAVGIVDAGRHDQLLLCYSRAKARPDRVFHRAPEGLGGFRRFYANEGWAGVEEDTFPSGGFGSTLCAQKRTFRRRAMIGEFPPPGAVRMLAPAMRLALCALL